MRPRAAESSGHAKPISLADSAQPISGRRIVRPIHQVASSISYCCQRVTVGPRPAIAKAPTPGRFSGSRGLSLVAVMVGFQIANLRWKGARNPQRTGSRNMHQECTTPLPWYGKTSDLSGASMAVTVGFELTVTTGSPPTPAGIRNCDLGAPSMRGALQQCSSTAMRTCASTTDLDDAVAVANWREMQGHLQSLGAVNLVIRALPSIRPSVSRNAP